MPAPEDIKVSGADSDRGISGAADPIPGDVGAAPQLIEDSGSPTPSQPVSTDQPREGYADRDRPGENAARQSETIKSNLIDPWYLDLMSFRICQVIVPVTLCALYAVILNRVIEFSVFRSKGVIERAYEQIGLDLGKATTIANNIILVGSFVGLIVLVTLIMLVIFHMQWFGCLNYYFYVPTAIVMGLLTPAYFKECLMALNWFAIDLITVLLISWNFTALGMIAIFNIYVGAPLSLQQFYLIHNSAILATIFIYHLPGWAPWLLLIALIVWDLFAVLTPCGPLNLLLDMAEREGVVDMPGIVYSTDVPEPEDKDRKQEGVPSMQTATSDQPPSSTHTNEQAQKDNRIEAKAIESRKINPAGGTSEQVDLENQGVNVGLGDFIFYSLLIGLASRGRQREDFYSTLAALLAILVGLVITLSILALRNRALPALPISIGLGLIFAPLTDFFGADFANTLADEQVFV